MRLQTGMLGPSLGVHGPREPDLRFLVAAAEPGVDESASRNFARLVGGLVEREAEIATLGKLLDEDWRGSCWHRWWCSGAMSSDRIELLLRIFRLEAWLASETFVRDTPGRRVALEDLVEVARSVAMFVERVSEPVENGEIGLLPSIDDRLRGGFQIVVADDSERPAHALWTRRCARALRRHDTFARVGGPLEETCTKENTTWKRHLKKFASGFAEGAVDLDDALREHLQTLAAECKNGKWDVSKSVPTAAVRRYFAAADLPDDLAAGGSSWHPDWIRAVLDMLSAERLPGFRSLWHDDVWEHAPSAVALAWVLGSMVREVRNALTHGAGFRAMAYPMENAAVWTRPGTVKGPRIVITLASVRRLFAMLTWSLSVIDRLDHLPP